jgi:hypothetical protein
MTRPGTPDQSEVMAALGVDTGAVPASLKAEYQELFLKREQLRAELERAKTELAGLRAKRKARTTERA